MRELTSKIAALSIGLLLLAVSTPSHVTAAPKPPPTYPPPRKPPPPLASKLLSSLEGITWVGSLTTYFGLLQARENIIDTMGRPYLGAHALVLT